MPEKGPLTCWRQMAAFSVSKWGSWWPIGKLSVSAFRSYWKHLNLISGSPSKLYLCAKTQKIAGCWYGGQNVQKEGVFANLRGRMIFKCPENRWRPAHGIMASTGIILLPWQILKLKWRIYEFLTKNPKNAKKQKVAEIGPKSACMTLKGP